MQHLDSEVLPTRGVLVSNLQKVQTQKILTANAFLHPTKSDMRHTLNLPLGPQDASWRVVLPIADGEHQLDNGHKTCSGQESSESFPFAPLHVPTLAVSPQRSDATLRHEQSLNALQIGTACPELLSTRILSAGVSHPRDITTGQEACPSPAHDHRRSYM